MFSPADRHDLRECLVAAARAEERIVAAAVVGSAAAGLEDEWSDIDLAFPRHRRRPRRLRVTPDGAALAPRAVAEVERVDAAFFAAGPRADAVDLLTRLRGQDQPAVPTTVEA